MVYAELEPEEECTMSIYEIRKMLHDIMTENRYIWIDLDYKIQYSSERYGSEFLARDIREALDKRLDEYIDAKCDDE